MPFAILLVDDHRYFEKGCDVLLESESDIRIVGEAQDGQAAVDRVRELEPDAVIMDITMPNLNGIEATRSILAEFPHTKVVALSIHSGKQFVADMLRAGAAGYILKESVPEELINGLRTVMKGEVYLSAAIAGVVVEQYLSVLSQVPDADENVDPAPLLLTKLHRPPVSPDILPRERLLKRIDMGRSVPLDTGVRHRRAMGKPRWPADGWRSLRYRGCRLDIPG